MLPKKHFKLVCFWLSQKVCVWSENLSQGTRAHAHVNITKTRFRQSNATFCNDCKCNLHTVTRTHTRTKEEYNE